MISIFTIPKAFKGHIAVIQRNAIKSWTFLHPNIDIMVCGDDEGTEGISKEYGLRWISHIKLNNYGTPLLDSAFSQAASAAHHRLLCYINSDIILMNDFIGSIKRIPFQEFLLTGRRWNVNITSLLDFSEDNWENNLLNFVKSQGTLDVPIAMDYFVFPTLSDLKIIPPFAVGRPFWDNFFIYKALQHKIPVIDATKSITAIHQLHTYEHVPQKSGKRWEGPEAEDNRLLVSNINKLFSTYYATHVLTRASFKKAREYQYVFHRIAGIEIFYPKYKWLFELYRSIKNTFGKSIQ
jgi:hypothetical protein